LPEYVITPEKKDLPSGPFLMEEMHRRGFPLEINVKGGAEKWDAIRFYEPGPPEVECFLSLDDDNGRLNVSVSVDSPPHAFDMQMILVELLLQEVGGQVDNLTTRERLTLKEVSAKIRSHHRSKAGPMDFIWIGFSWAVVVLAMLAYVFEPQARGLILVLLFFSLVSAGGLTYSHFKP